MNLVSISIVEDLDEVREALQRLINQSEKFCFVAGYNNAELAVKEIPLQCPDIVIMDINLPGMSGIECIRRLKEKCNSTQFMMFTIYEDDEKVFEALKAGASGYMLKKHGSERIIESLKELYKGGSPMSADIARKVVSTFHGVIETDDQDYHLTKREKDTLQLLAKGLLYKEISQHLGISANTVKQHIHNIYEKLHVQNRTEALNKYFQRK